VAPIALAGASLGLRPEHITLAGSGGVAATVDGVEYLGADSLLGCNIGPQPVTARVAGRVALQKGDVVRLAWAGGAEHYFDGITGERRERDIRHESATMLA